MVQKRFRREMYFFFLFNIYLDKKRSTSSHVGNKVQRIARSRRAMNFAQWSFFGGRKEASSYWRLVSWIEHKETRKRWCCCVFFSSKCHHIHLLLQALGRMKKETSRNHLSHSSHHCFPLHCVLKALRLLRMMEHLVSQSVLGRVLRGTFLRTQIVAST